MAVAKLQTHFAKAKVYRNKEGEWCVKRNYHTEIWKYTNWKSAFNNAYLNIALMRKSGL
jgi:hypothetical protein